MSRLGRGYPPNSFLLPFVLDDTPARQGALTVDGGGVITVVVDARRHGSCIITGGGTVGVAGFNYLVARVGQATVGGGGDVTVQGYRNARVYIIRWVVGGTMTYEEVFGTLPPIEYR